MKAFAAALGLALLAAQDQPPPKPTFKSAVDLVPVDVNVIDKSGRPVPDLAAGDFTLTVDGKPRRIVSAQFISVDRAVDSAPPSKPMECNSNTGAQGGRLVMIAVDSNMASFTRDAATAHAAAKLPSNAAGIRDLQALKNHKASEQAHDILCRMPAILVAKSEMSRKGAIHCLIAPCPTPNTPQPSGAYVRHGCYCYGYMPPLDARADSFLPLTPAVFHLLLALADGPLHGYAIAKTVAEQTGQRVHLGPGTLYGTLTRMTEAELVREHSADDRRRTYALTPLGRAVARAEARRLAQLVSVARSKALLTRSPQ